MWMSAQIHITLTLGLGLSWPFWLLHLKKGGMYFPWCGRNRQYLAARYRSWWSLVLFTKYCSRPPCRHRVELHFPLPLLGLYLGTLFMIKDNVSRVGYAISEMCLNSTPAFQAMRDCRAQFLLIHAGHISWIQNYQDQFVRGAIPSLYQLILWKRWNGDWKVGRKCCLTYWEVDWEQRPQRGAGVRHTNRWDKRLGATSKAYLMR